LLKDKTEQHQIVSATDWRQRVLSGMPSWYAPDDATNRQQMSKLFSRLTNDAEIVPVSVVVAGREITIDHAACNIGIVSFDDICARSLAARDYIILADRFSGLMIFGIPVMTEEMRNESRRFMWLVDAFYDRGRFLVCSADVALKDIYSGQSWVNEFPRTVSRLTEMTKI
jgi:cell division protein ZapE